MEIVIAILAFCVIIIIHELGHFTAAKLCGIQVNEFALGMGPVIFRRQGKETAYVIRLLPIGGSVSMEGEDSESDNPRAFNRKPVWQRMIVILAGAIMNLILGYFVVMLSLGISDAVPTTVISGFREQSVSMQQLKVGDEIKSINGLPIFTSSDIVYKIQSSDVKNEQGNLIYDFVVVRNGETITLNDVELMTRANEDGTSSVYFDFTVEPMEKNFINLVTESFKESVSTGRLIIMSLIDMIGGRYNINDLSGPVGVVDVVAKSVGIDPSLFFSIVSLITINVGVFNLLPIPALDGCRFLFLVIEAIRRKPLKPEVEGMVHFIGFALLMILMLVVTFNDISRLITGGGGV
ncbi:MAG: site-2 protease family protein [Oscillospiraceae bacterium]|nr:site-2 protease family protein [Oscillospiraceae bacterium]